MAPFRAEILALVAPPGCVSCRAPTAAGERLCASCTRALPWLRRTCRRCALPSHRGRPCPAGAAAFAAAWAPMAYDGVARDLVGALKFRAALPVADLMAAHMAANLPADLRGPATATSGPAVPASWPAAAAHGRPAGAAGPWVGASPRAGSAGDAVPWPAAAAHGRSAGAAGPWVGASPRAGSASDAGPAAAARGRSREGAVARVASALPVIVPVPTVAARRRRRGFDPAGILAVALARRLERPLVACLERRDRAPRQVGATRKARRAAGRLAFAARSQPPPLVLLVDDVHTTGATLDAAARALAVEGSAVVAALSYARTL